MRMLGALFCGRGALGGVPLRDAAGEKGLKALAHERVGETAALVRRRSAKPGRGQRQGGVGAQPDRQQDGTSRG